MMIMMKRLFSACLISLLFIAWTVSLSVGQGLSPEDVANIKSVGTAAMNPDGNDIAYTLTVLRGDSETPLLVAHGLADERVHPEQSIQLHQFLEMKGIPTGLVLYPRQPHGLTERAHQIDFMNRVVYWFNEYLR